MRAGQRILFAAVCAVAVATLYAVQPVLAQAGTDLGLPEAHVGRLVAAGQLGYLAGLAVLVPLGDLADRRALITAHLLLTAAGSALAATASSAGAVIAGLATAGVFAVVVQTTVAYATTLSRPGERGRDLGVITSGVVLGVLGSRVAAGALGAVWGWRAIYLVLAGALVVLGVLVRVMLPPDRRAARPTYRQVVTSMGGMFRERLFLTRGLITFFLFASFGTLWSGLALPLAAEPWHLDPARIGLFGIAGLAGALGAARAGRWADTGRANAVTGGALALLALSWAPTAQAPWSLWLVGLGVVALDFAVQAVHVSNQHLLTTVHPDRAGSVIGGYMIFYALGSAFGATATTTVFAAAGWAGSSGLGLTFAACAFAVWLFGRRAATTRPAPVGTACGTAG